MSEKEKRDKSPKGAKGTSDDLNDHPKTNNESHRQKGEKPKYRQKSRSLSPEQFRDCSDDELRDMLHDMRQQMRNAKSKGNFDFGVFREAFRSATNLGSSAARFANRFRSRSSSMSPVRGQSRPASPIHQNTRNDQSEYTSRFRHQNTTGSFFDQNHDFMNDTRRPNMSQTNRDNNYDYQNSHGQQRHRNADQHDFSYRHSRRYQQNAEPGTSRHSRFESHNRGRFSFPRASRDSSDSSDNGNNYGMYDYRRYPSIDLGRPSAPIYRSEPENPRCAVDSEKRRRYAEQLKNILGNVNDAQIEKLINEQLMFEESNFIERNNYARFRQDDNSSIIRTPHYVKQSKKFNSHKVKFLTDTLRRQIMYLDHYPFHTFIEQFEAHDLGGSHGITEPEFNILIANFLGKQIKAKMANSGCNPLQCSTELYLNNLARVSGHHQSVREIENKLMYFKTNSDNIFDIFNEIVVLQNQLPDLIYSPDHKDRQLRNIIENFCPEGVKTLLNESWIGPGHRQPTRDQLQNFVTRHNDSINRFIKYKRIRSGNRGHNLELENKQDIRKISNSHSETKSDDQKTSKTVSDCNTSGQKYYEFHEFQYDSENDISDSDEELSDSFDPSIHKITQPKQYSKAAQEAYALLKCSICKRRGHRDLQCFRHPDPNVALKNQQKRNLSICMLCGEKGHLSPNCKTYPGLTPSYETCSLCNEKGEYERYHPPPKCKQSKETKE